MSERLLALAPTANLLGWFLLRELDVELLALLRESDIENALREVRIEIPDATSSIDELHAEYFDCFLNPVDGAPLIQSLWEGGSYSGPPATRLAQLAEPASLEIDSERTRGAPVDHIGCILQLWSKLMSSAPQLAATIAEHHLLWAVDPLRRIGQRSCFYGQVADASAELIGQIAANKPTQSASG